MSKKRIKWLDVSKGFTILFVVLCHSLVVNRNQGLEAHVDVTTLYWINTFIMPCFFAISGYLYRRVHSFKSYGMLWYKKVVGLVFPYVWFSLIMDWVLHIKNIWGFIYQPTAYLWFLPALFLIFIIVGTLDLIHIPVFVQLLLYLGLAFYPKENTWIIAPHYGFNLISAVSGYLIFFYAGYLFKRFAPETFDRLGNSLPILSGLTIFWIIVVLLQLHLTGVFPYNTDFVVGSDIFTKLLSLPMVFGWLNRFQNVGFSNWLSRFGKYTLVVYLFHYPVIHYMHLLMWHFGFNRPLVVSVIAFVMAVFLSIIVAQLTRHSRFLTFIFYPRTDFDQLLK